MSEKLQEKYITVQGIKTHYWEIGNGEPVIFIHGGGAGADGWGNWHHLLPLFANEGFRAIAMDMIGFGLSDAPDSKEYEYTNSSRVEHLIGFIDALQLQQTHLVGNSMGGSSSLGVAIKRPELVKKMILLGSSGRLKPNVEESEGLQSLTEYEYGWDKMLRIVRSLTNDSFEIKDDMINYRLKLTARPEVKQAYQATMGFVRSRGMYYDEAELRQIKNKALLIHGKKDGVVPVADSWDIANMLDNAALYVLPNCGHWAMLEYPEEFLVTSVRFLRN